MLYFFEIATLSKAIYLSIYFKLISQQIISIVTYRDVNPIQSNPIQSNPIQSNPIQSNPIQSNPIQSNPIQSNPIFPSMIAYFVKIPVSILRWLAECQDYSALFTIPIYYSLVPVLSMMMDFLCLAYGKYEYKYTLIEWKWYIVIRSLVSFFIGYSTSPLMGISFGYQTIYSYLQIHFMEFYQLSILYNLYDMPRNSIYT